MPERPEDLARRWQRAEERLYPVVLVRPEVYELSLRLVRAAADRLALCHDEEALAAAYGGAGELVARAALEEEIPTTDLDLGLVADAAFSQRRREVVVEMHRAEAIRRIGAARQEGEPWTVLYETGSGFPPIPYRRLEMRVADGVGIHAFVEQDPDTALPVYGLEAIQLDPETGDWTEGAAQLADRQLFGSRQDWEAAIGELRERLIGLTP